MSHHDHTSQIVVHLRDLVILGYVGWAAGNFYPTYVLGETPTDAGGVWSDTSLVAACLAPNK